jgi:hypothetical protein
MEPRGEREARRLEAAIQRLLSEASSWREEDLYARASEGDWTAMEVMAHTTEMQPYWARQIQRVLAQPGGPFGRTHDDTERTGFVEAHAKDRLADALVGLQQARDEAAAVLRSLSDHDWSQVGIHSRRGEMSVADIAESFLVGHAEEHVEQAIRAVEAAVAPN